MEERSSQPSDRARNRTEFQSLRTPNEHERYIEIRRYDNKIFPNCCTNVHRKRSPAAQ